MKYMLEFKSISTSGRDASGTKLWENDVFHGYFGGILALN